MSFVSTRIVQISDIHLFSDKNQSLLGVNTYKSFSTLINLLKNDKVQPEAIILSGDLSQDHTEASYRNVVDVIKEIRVPIYIIPGNHDDGKLLAQLFPQKNISNAKNFVMEQWQFILLDSQKRGEVAGYLNDNELEFMQTSLEKNPDHYAIIVLHHHPVSVGSEWLDSLGLKNSNIFWDILKQYPNVKAVLFGHVHQEYSGAQNGIQLYSVPSTCIQFAPNKANFALDKLPPAYRWMDLKENGKLTTGITRCAQYIGDFDPNAKGY